MRKPDFTKLGWFDKTFDNCTVTTIPAGATPKVLKVRLPGGDGPIISVWWSGFPSLAVNDTVSVRYSPGNQAQYVISGTSGATASGSGLPAADAGICQGRLTLTSETAITTADVTAATTIYFSPYGGNRIALYTGSVWREYDFGQLSLSLSGLTANTVYDVFVYDNSGTLILEAVAWSSGTARATALALQDGVYVKSGATTRRYLGTFRTTGSTGQTEKSAANCFLWNYYHRVPFRLAKMDITGHTTNTAVWRQFRAAGGNQINVVIGLAETMTELIFIVDCSAGSGGWYAGAIGYDSTTAPASSYFLTFSTLRGGVFSNFRHYPAIGFHNYNLLEITSGATATVSAGYLEGSVAC